MNVIKVDAARRLRLPRLRPGDLYEPEYLSAEEVVLRRVPEPKRRARPSQRRVTNVDPLPDRVLEKLYREREEEDASIRRFIEAQPKDAE
jgi:hypothetical protein